MQVRVLEGAAEIALILAAVVVREVVHHRVGRKGGAGGSAFGGQASVVIWNVAWLALGALAVSAILSGVSAALFGVAGVLVWTGALLRAGAYRALGEHYARRIVILDGHAVVRTGPYRILRHPLHVGLMLEMTGLAAVAGNWLGWTLLAVSAAVMFMRNNAEERVLTMHLGADYDAFRRRTWDFVDLTRHRGWRRR